MNVTDKDRRRSARRTVWTAMLCLGLTLTMIADASARNYVSWKGGFYISYPDSWRPVDYALADAFLQINQAGEEILDYDVVVADTLAEAFFDGSYFVLTVDTVGVLTEAEIDSVLGDLFSTFHARLSYFPVANLMANLRANSPSYDADQKIATVVNEIEIVGGTFKRSLLMLRFYDKGIATFYFYAPDSAFEDGVRVMQQVVSSLSTENIEAAVTPQEVRVTDAPIPQREQYQPGSAKSTSNRSMPVAVAIGIMVVLIVVARRKRKKRS